MTNKRQSLLQKDTIGRTLFLVFIYFLFLYPFKIPGLPFGTVIPIIVVFAVIALCSLIDFRKYGKMKTTKMVKQYWGWNLFLVLYVLLLLLTFGSGNGITPIRDYVNILIILPAFYISGQFVFNDVEDLMRILYIGVIIQSVIIIAALLIPALSLALFQLIPEGGFNSDNFGGVDMITKYGYHVGLGVFASAGSLRMAIGQVGAFYYLITNRGNRLFIHLITYLLISIATSLVSRTGLVVSVVGLFFVLYTKGKTSRKRVWRYISLLLFTLLIGYTIVVNTFTSDFLRETFQRYSDTAEKGIYDTYFKGYTGEGGSNSIPPISTETIIGLGITYGTSGTGVTTITDGGFLRNYSAMGLIVAIINYVIIACFFKRQYKMSNYLEYKGVILFLSFIFIIGEFKEYFLYYISPICFLFLIFCMMERTENINIPVRKTQ